MIIKRQEPWGHILYNSKTHRFSYSGDKVPLVPYSYKPVLLNVYLTMKCNMTCSHCVTKDFPVQQDLVVTNKMIEYLNDSDYLVIVITGGEPFLPEYSKTLHNLLMGIKNKAIIVDTNGTQTPNNQIINLLVKKKVLVRISWDSTRPADEIYYRHLKNNDKKNMSINEKCYKQKIENIKVFQSKGINVAIQTVVNKRNRISILQLPQLLIKYRIKKWYLQRFIPAHLSTSSNHSIDTGDFLKTVDYLSKACSSLGIECIAKKDRRHNSVIMMVGNGQIYTQGNNPGEKVFLGNINDNIDFFKYVSASDHAERYYGI